MKLTAGKVIAVDDGLRPILESVRQGVGAHVNHRDGIGILSEAEGESSPPAFNRAGLDSASHTNAMPGGPSLLQLVYGDVISFTLLESRNCFPAHHAENNADTYPEL